MAASGFVTILRTQAGVSAQREQFFADVLATLDADERVQLVRLTEKAALALRTHSRELVTR